VGEALLRLFFPREVLRLTSVFPFSVVVVVVTKECSLGDIQSEVAETKRSDFQLVDSKRVVGEQSPEP